MALTVDPVRSAGDLEEFVAFPWSIYRDDPYWVPPLVDDRLSRLDPARSPFWKNATRELYIARQDGRCAGTIACIVDQGRIRALGQPVGCFGFFECIPDPLAARGLIGAGEDWLRKQGMQMMRGPYNPSGEDECGILVEGFQTRPALLEAHTLPYYPRLLEECGMVKYRDMFARLWSRQAGLSREEQMPGKLFRAAGRAGDRPDLRIRRLKVRAWEQEIEMAWRMYTRALSELPEYVPVALEDFRAMASSFRAIMDPRLALVAEIYGKPVGFVLALPDANEALQKVVSRRGPRRLRSLDLLRLLWHTRRSTRATYKILIILPEYQGRGIEAVLSAALAKAIWEIGYREVDMSLTGEENEKSNRFQENLGFRVYRRYRIYQKELT